MQKSTQLFSINTFCRSTNWHDFETVILVPFSLLLFKFCSNNRLLAHLIIAPLYDIMFPLDALANKHPLSCRRPHENYFKNY